MSSNSKVAETISKTYFEAFYIPPLLQRYFNKIALGITSTFDSIVEQSANKRYIVPPPLYPYCVAAPALRQPGCCF